MSEVPYRQVEEVARYPKDKIYHRRKEILDRRILTAGLIQAGKSPRLSALFMKCETNS